VAGAQASAGAVLVAVTAIAHYQHAYGVREDAVAGPGGFVIGTDLRLLALGLVIVVPALVLDGKDADSWATAAVWALAVLVALSSTVRSLRAWITPSDPDSASPGAQGAASGQNEQSIDRMQSVNAETGMTVPRQAIGGVR